MKKPPAPEEEICLCLLFGLLDVVAKKWALLIIAILGNEGSKGFNELKTEFGAISPKTLSDNAQKSRTHRSSGKEDPSDIAADNPVPAHQRRDGAPRTIDPAPCLGVGARGAGFAGLPDTEEKI